MNHLTTSTLSIALLAAGSALAQSPNFLTSYSLPEANTSGSGGTVLSMLRPNEIHYIDFAAGPCPGAPAEKWLPRTCAHVMAGDEDANGTHFNPSIFGNVDAILANQYFAAPVPLENQRTVYWSVSQPMGTNISATPFRPGDVARIVRIGAGEGQVQHFMRQEQFNMALGLPPAFPIDIDAIAFQPNYGVWFSVDSDVNAVTACGPVLVRDGDVLCIPGGALGYTPDLRIAAVAANSAVVVHSEAAMNVFTANAQVTDRFGACIPNVIDVEALEIDLFGPSTTIVPCPGVMVVVPTLLYTTETGTGASVLTTLGGGQIYNTICGPAGTSCGFGPTYGPQWGVRPPTIGTGVASFVDGLAFARVCTHVLEPQQHVMNVFPGGAPAGANAIDYNNPFVVSLILIELVSPIVPASVPVPPGVSPTCFPDLYAPSISPWLPVPNGFGSFAFPAIPPLFTGKVLFQGVGFGSGALELSTPCVVDVQ